MVTPFKEDQIVDYEAAISIAKKLVEDNIADTIIIAGHIPLNPDVLSSLSKPIISHQSREFRDLFLETISLAKKVFRTKKDVLILPCSGTGGV